ncbi:MAG: SDR family oxidoreductase [Candidatus Brocadiia bacterium]
MSLEGRTALVTGSCGEGMGRSIALRLARERANLVLNYGTARRTKRQTTQATKRAERVAAAVRELGGQAIIQPADTRDEEQVRAMVEAAEEEFGAVDILVSNAGGDWRPRDFTEVPLDEWRNVLQAEIDGAFLTMKHCVPGMRERAWGRIVLLGMRETLHMTLPSWLAPDYCLGKAVRAWMAEALWAGEFPHGVTVNCLEPGHIEHATLEEAVAAARELPDRDEARPYDVAEVVAFLCSEAGRFVTGSQICCGALPD